MDFAAQRFLATKKSAQRFQQSRSDGMDGKALPIDGSSRKKATGASSAADDLMVEIERELGRMKVEEQVCILPSLS